MMENRDAWDNVNRWNSYLEGPAISSTCRSMCHVSCSSSMFIQHPPDDPIESDWSLTISEWFRNYHSPILQLSAATRWNWRLILVAAGSTAGMGSLGLVLAQSEASDHRFNPATLPSLALPQMNQRFLSELTMKWQCMVYSLRECNLLHSKSFLTSYVT